MQARPVGFVAVVHLVVHLVVCLVVCQVLAACVSPGAPAPAAAPPFRVVALGDSFASGQGAPNVDMNLPELPTWDDRRCNRSSNAPTSVAVRTLATHGHSAISDSLACSGASIGAGLLGEQMGPEPPPGAPKLPPQVERLDSLDSPVDAVTIFVGGNDILFQNIVAACIVLWDCSLDPDPVDNLLAQLPAGLDRLAAALDSTGIPPERILILEYPDPTGDEGGAYCGGKPFGDPLAGLSEAEAEWASQSILPRLNHALCQAAQRHGWTYVDGIAARFAGHGWCAEGGGAWINTMNESMRKQASHRGALHPNATGYLAIGARLAEVLEPLLEGESPPGYACPEPGPSGALSSR